MKLVEFSSHSSFNNDMAQQVVTIIGGTGFLGRYIVKRLAAAGYTIRVIARHPNAALYLKTSGHAGQIVLESGDLTNPDSLQGKLDYSHAVINLAGILSESGQQDFNMVHTQGAAKAAQLAKLQGAQRFIHISALGVDKADSSAYAHTKLMGERAVLAAFPEATILRPSVIFGPEDQFFNRFAALSVLSPALPLIGGGETKFQPVYARDVARAMESSLMRPETMGETYELGGPRVYSFKQIVEYILSVTGKNRMLVPLSFGAASLVSRIAQYLPYPFSFTPDQVRLLRYDNVVSPGALTFADLGIRPIAAETVVPEYLARFNRKTASAAAGERFKI